VREPDGLDLRRRPDLWVFGSRRVAWRIDEYFHGSRDSCQPAHRRDEQLGGKKAGDGRGEMAELLGSGTVRAARFGRENALDLLEVIEVVARKQAHDVFDGFLAALGMHAVVFPLFR
jgi:hypothetical protein